MEDCEDDDDCSIQPVFRIQSPSDPRTLAQNLQFGELFIEGCGCRGETENQVTPDENGIIIGNTGAHCPTVCWVSQHIVDLLPPELFIFPESSEPDQDSGNHDEGQGEEQ